MSTVYFPNHPFFFTGSGSGSGTFCPKNLSDESSSLTYQKYWAIGIMNDPTTKIERSAVYFPFNRGGGTNELMFTLM